jgi:pilus assembly protein CpaC
MRTDFSRTTYSETESEDLKMLAASTTQFWRSRPLQGRRPAAFFAALVVYIIVILVAAPQAQQAQVISPAATASATIVRDASSGSDIDLMVGRSTVLNVGAQIARVSLTVPDIADALVTAPSQLLIHGKKPGTISMFVWDKAGAISTFEVKVRRDLSPLVAHIKQLFPGEDITVLGSGKDIVLSGTVSTKYVMEKAADMAGGYVDKKEDVVNMLKQQEGVASNQVMLRVRFAEVSRSAMQELGASLFANGSGSSDQWYGRSAPPGVPAPTFEEGKLVFSDFLNLFVFNAKEQLGAVVRALSNKGLFQSLAEPNLIATNGKEASFLAGGEYPYPVVQSGSGTNSVTITFKEFGVRLSFTPTVLSGDLIHLKVKPEVSSLDFANAVVIDGFRVPALSTRRTETEVELRDGQTFAIAGLMNNTLTSTMSKIPGIGDIPILGLLFKSKAHQKNQTELVVMITPQILKRGSMGVSEGLPAVIEPYLSRPDKTHPSPDPYIGSPRYPADRPQPKEGNAPVTPRGAQMSEPSAPAVVPAPKPANVTAAAAPAAPAPVPSRPISQSAPVAAPPAVRPATPASTPSQQVAVTPAPAKAAVATPQAPAAKPAATTTPSESKEAAASVKTQIKEADKAAERAAEKAREQERRAAEAEAKQKQADARQQEIDARQKAEEDRIAQAKAEEDRKQADRLSKDRAKREADIARRNAEVAKKQADEDAKREKALAEAAARLKQAQTAYQAEIEKTKGGSSNEKSAKDSSTKQ